MRSARRVLCAAVLAFEAPCVFFGGLVAKDLSSLSTGAAVGGASALAVLCLVVAGLLRAAWSYHLGSALQVVIIATGVVVPAMFVVGGIFGLLWVVALRQGGRLDRRDAALLAAYEASAGSSRADPAGE